jgi:hypothetical protein
MMTKCAACESPHALAACRVCGKLVCPKHRVGTGSLSDGYNCSGTGSSCWLGFVGEELKTPTQPKINYWRWDKTDVKLVLMTVALVLLGILLGALPIHPR